MGICFPGHYKLICITAVHCYITSCRTMLSVVSRGLLSRTAGLGSVRCFSDLSSRFEAAQTKLNTLTEDPGNAAKLKIYGLFKQVIKS